MLGLYKKQLWISTFKNQQFIHANHYLTWSGHYSFNFPQLLFFLPLAKKWGGFSPPSPTPSAAPGSLLRERGGWDCIVMFATCYSTAWCIGHFVWYGCTICSLVKSISRFALCKGWVELNGYSVALMIWMLSLNWMDVRYCSMNGVCCDVVYHVVRLS